MPFRFPEGITNVTTTISRSHAPAAAIDTAAIDTVLAPYTAPGTGGCYSLQLPAAQPLSDAVERARYRDLLAAARATVAAARRGLPNPLGWLEDELAAYDLMPADGTGPRDFVRVDEEDDVWANPHPTATGTAR